jgi:hypothetical protein
MEPFCVCHNYITPEKRLQAGKKPKKEKKAGNGKDNTNESASSAESNQVSVKGTYFN